MSETQLDKGTSVQKPEPNKPNDSKGMNKFLFGFTAFLVATAIMVSILGGCFYYVIHNNINGLAERYRPEIGSIPFLAWMLPEQPEIKDPKLMTETQLREKYTEYTAKISELTKQLEEANKKIAELQSFKDSVDKATAESAKMKKDAEDQKVILEAEKKRLNELKTTIDGLIVNGDTQGFKTYFEQVDSETAKKLYEEIIKKLQSSVNEIKFAQIYENMDPSAAAKIFEQMGDAKIALVVETLKNMKKEISSEILASMGQTYAAKVTEKLSKALK